MPNTVRENILQAFAAKVGAGRCLKLDDSSDLPAKSIWDNQESAQKQKFGITQATLALPVEYLAKVDLITYANLSAQANAMLGELIQDATQGDRTLGGLCESISYTESEFIYPEDGAQEIEVYAVFTVVYEFATGDPFASA